MQCITMTKSHMIVNEKTENIFQLKQGICQAEPISPSICLSYARKGKVYPFYLKIGNDQVKISSYLWMKISCLIFAYDF